MKALNNIFRRATENPKRVVLAEGEDLRIITAAVTATERGIADITLLGDVNKINTEAAAAGLDLKGVSVIDPAESKAIEHYADAFYQLRQHKGMTMGKAVELMQDPLHFAQMMVHLNDADGSVCGAVYTTGDTVRAAIQIIGMAENASMISSFFLMMLCEPFHQLKGGVIFSDCGLVIDPNKEQLAQIAMSASNSARTLLEEEPKVAMLSFSTSGSANHAAVDKVVEATAIVKQHMPDLAIDGDVQLDAAIVSEIAERKVSDSETQGKANVLVFPNLEAGNIG